MGSIPSPGTYVRQLINVSLSRQFLSLSHSFFPSLSLPLSLKLIKIPSGENLKRQRETERDRERNNNNSIEAETKDAIWPLWTPYASELTGKEVCPYTSGVLEHD